jgi:hypothetical protein
MAGKALNKAKAKVARPMRRVVRFMRVSPDLLRVTT